MDEHVLAAVSRLNKPIAFLFVIKLHGSNLHGDDLLQMYELVRTLARASKRFVDFRRGFERALGAAEANDRSLSTKGH